nr:hypothetical protein [Tanacetum cinerariifolium]
MASLSDRGKLASMEDVVGTGLVSSSPMDGIASDKGGDKFEFVDAERFVEKLKKGSEEVALKMEYVPSAVSKMENGNKRIMFSAKEVIKGGQAWIFYFKFKSKEGMKSVLESGPWMVQNVPLVLNVWEPGIWLEKTEPSSIPIWVCVHNISMELCNGNGIRKIMSGIGKPMLMDRMT